MKQLIIALILIVLCTPSAFSQIIKVGTGDYYYQSNTESPTVNGYTPRLNTPVFTFSVEKQVRRLNFRLGYSKFDGITGLKVDSPRWKGNGFHGANLERYFFDFGFAFFDMKKGGNMIPYIGLISETALPLAQKHIGTYLDKGYDPHYEGYITVEAFNNTQLIPAVGIDFNLQLPVCFTATFNMHYSFGRERFQEQVFVYSYNGVPQPDGIIYEDGSGLFISILLGVDLSRIKLYDGSK